MGFIQCLDNFFRTIFSEFLEGVSGDVTENGVDIQKLGEKDESFLKEENTFDVTKVAMKSTWLRELYLMEQEIAVFKQNFPNDYEAFFKRIESLKADYMSSLEAIAKELTFEIDPDLDFKKIGEIEKLKRDIRRFIETEVRFNILSNRIQSLLVKMNILYNASIQHFTDKDKQKVLSQLNRIIEKENSIVQEFKKCDYILNDTRLRERIMDLIGYVDYLILKLTVRNSKKIPGEQIEKLVILTEFERYDYVETFKNFIRDEIYQLTELANLIRNQEHCIAMKAKIGKLLTELLFCEDVEVKLWNPNFWKEFLENEASVLEILKSEGVTGEILLIARMDIKVEKDEVLTSPITTSYLALANLYSATHEECILPLLKLLQNVSKEVTYKEIYFLTLLFGVIEPIESVPNDLLRHIEKYLTKYPYDSSEIENKKRSVMRMHYKEYIVVFSLDDYSQKVISTLQKLNLDFEVVDNKVLMNVVYFKQLENVLKSLQVNNH